MEGDFIVYQIRNQRGRRYIGITSDINKRLHQHNKNFSTYTKYKGPWQLSWISCLMSHSEALKLEKLMKRQKGGIGLQKLMNQYSDINGKYVLD